MARTRHGATGPMRAYATFTAKTENTVSFVPRLTLLGAGCWLLWMLIYE